jgi:hypothetical protein
MAYTLDEEPKPGQPSPEHVTPQPPPYPGGVQPGTPGHPEYNRPSQEMADRYAKQQELLQKAGGGHQGEAAPDIVLPIEEPATTKEEP